MIDVYLVVKLIHILSATVVFGTGMGIAYFMFSTWVGRDLHTFLEVSKRVVVADWLFTTPAVIIQFTTGLYLTHRLAIPFDSMWFVSVTALFILIGCCWLPVVWLQVKIRERITQGSRIEDVHHLMTWWVGLGVVAFFLILVIFFLMVFKVGISHSIGA